MCIRDRYIIPVVEINIGVLEFESILGLYIVNFVNPILLINNTIDRSTQRCV